MVGGGFQLSGGSKLVKSHFNFLFLRWEDCHIWLTTSEDSGVGVSCASWWTRESGYQDTACHFHHIRGPQPAVSIQAKCLDILGASISGVPWPSMHHSTQANCQPTLEPYALCALCDLRACTEWPHTLYLCMAGLLSECYTHVLNCL